MKRNQSNLFLSTIAAAVVTLMAGCATKPSAEVVADELQIEVADLKP